MSSQSTKDIDTLAEGIQEFTLEQPAATAVLDTNELLKKILSQVPCEYRVNLRRVSKTWKHVVSEVGYAVEPVYARPSHDPEKGVPYYPNHLTIKCHPVTGKGYRRKGSAAYSRYVENRSRCAELHMTNFNLRKGELEEFITDPPITQVAVSYHDVNTATWGIEKLATLRVPGGIRIMHLRGTFRKMTGVPLTWRGERRVPKMRDLVAEFRLSWKVPLLASGSDQYVYGYERNDFWGYITSDSEDESSEVKEPSGPRRKAKIQWSHDLLG